MKSETISDNAYFRFFLCALLVSIILYPNNIIASTDQFVSSDFESGDLSGWTVVKSDPGFVSSVAAFDTVAGDVSYAATAPLSPGVGNFGQNGFDLLQTVNVDTYKYLHVQADVAAIAYTPGFNAVIAPLLNTASFDSSALLYFPLEVGTMRQVVEGTVFVPPGTYQIGFRFNISGTGLGGAAYLDNASLTATVQRPQGTFVCGSSGGTFGCPQNTPRPVPEPAAIYLFAAGVTLLMAWRLTAQAYDRRIW
jgi:hypothetical protein